MNPIVVKISVNFFAWIACKSGKPIKLQNEWTIIGVIISFDLKYRIEAYIPKSDV